MLLQHQFMVVGLFLIASFMAGYIIYLVVKIIQFKGEPVKLPPNNSRTPFSLEGF